MIVRAIDADGDWLFGKGKNDYKTGNDAVAQEIKTRLQSFLGDCFFSMNEGVDWFTFCGSKNQLAISLAVSAIILNTPNVDSIVAFSISLSDDRNLTLSYTVKTFFGTVDGEIDTGQVEFLLTESGDILAAEDGSFLSP